METRHPCTVLLRWERLRAPCPRFSAPKKSSVDTRPERVGKLPLLLHIRSICRIIMWKRFLHPVSSRVSESHIISRKEMSL